MVFGDTKAAPEIGDLDDDDETTIETVEAVSDLHRPAERTNYLKIFWAYQGSRSNRVDNALSDASNRIEAATKAAKAVAVAAGRRERDATAKLATRASPDVLRSKRIAALSKLTTKPKGKFAEKLRGTEEALIAFKDAMIICDKVGRVRDKQLAETFQLITGDMMDKRQAQRRRCIVEKLERPGGIWFRLK